MVELKQDGGCPFCGGKLKAVRTETLPSGKIYRLRVCDTCASQWDSYETIESFYILNPQSLKKELKPATPENISKYRSCILNQGKHPDYRQLSFSEFE